MQAFSDLKKEGITRRGNVLFTPRVHYFRVNLWNHASRPLRDPSPHLSALTCTLGTKWKLFHSAPLWNPRALGMSL